MTAALRSALVRSFAIGCACVGILVLTMLPQAQQTVAAEIVAPANGASLLSTTVTFQWTSVSGFQAYYLYVGTSLGANNVVNTGEIQTTSRTVHNLPVGTTLYVRMWTKHGGVWRYADSTFLIQPLTATLTSPVNAQTGVALNGTFTWTAVNNAQTYYLYVGTTVGAKNILDSGETSQLSREYAGLQPQQTYYVRMWTRLGGVWRYVDSTFTTQNAPPQPVVATLLYPQNNAVGVTLPVTFQWTAIPAVQAYYLYVGTVPGANNVVDSKETSQTSWTTTLPGASTLHARLWTKAGGIWRYVDSKFDTQAVAAVLSYPIVGLTVPTELTFTWNPITGAQGYSLAVGTFAGGTDVVQSGEQMATSFAVTNLPQGSVLHARLGTNHDGVWRYTSRPFATETNKATLTSPANGATGVSPSGAFQWTTIGGAQWYRLQIGTTAGGSNVLDTGTTTQTAWTAALPDSALLHARLWTRHGDVNRYIDSTFSTQALRARFTYPTPGQVDVDPDHAFEWTAAPGADSYTLQIGTSWGGNDVLDTGEMNGTSFLPMALPATGTLYARIWTELDGALRFDDTAFTLEGAAPAAMLAPLDGESGFAAGSPFRWSGVPLARGYRLVIGSTPGASDLHDSGELFVTRQFVRDLPTGVTLHGQLQTHVGETWVSEAFTFSVGSNAPSNPATLDTMRWVTSEVRQMANADHVAMPWSELGRTLHPAQMGVATAADYARVLRAAIDQIDGDSETRALSIAFTPGTLDTHALVEFLRPDTGSWMLLDPTFALTINRASDAASATAADVQAATASQNWAAMSYEFLSPAGNGYAQAHYIDYPLLYLNVMPVPTPASPSPYLEERMLPWSGTADVYVIGCEGLTQASAVVDGQTVTVPCPGPESTSDAFTASQVSVPPGSAFRLFRLRRFVF